MAPRPDHSRQENTNPLADSQELRTLDESSQAAAELTTRRIGQFEVLEVLGQGAFGAVYHAKDTVLEREVAIKVPHASRITTQEMRQRFLREARSAAGLRHPHICPVFEVGEENDTPYIVMAFIKGQELSAVLKRRGHLTDRQAAVMVRRLALALEFAHQQGIVHRDLKPDNIMIDRERKEPVIMDFGLARRDSGKESQLTQEGQLMGTPVYMPPEQARGDIAQIGPASDIYSLGVILYELLCGRRPHEGSLAEVLSKVLTADAAPPSSIRSDIAPSLEAICMKAIAREVGDRYACMLEFADDLAEFLKSDSDSSTASANRVEDEPATKPVSETAAHTETVLVPVAEASVSTQSKRRPLYEVWIKHQIKLCVVAVAVLLLVLAIAGPWSGNGGAENAPDVVLTREFIGNSEGLMGVCLSPDNKWIAGSTHRGTLLVWHRDDLQPRFDKRVGKNIKQFQQFTVDSQSVLIHNGVLVKLISIQDGTETQIALKPKTSPTNATIDRSGVVYINRTVDGMIVVSKREQGQSRQIVTTTIPNGEKYLAWSAVLPESQIFVGVQYEGEVHFWDCEGHFTLQKSAELAEEHLTIAGRHDSLPTCLAWSADERIVATADSNGVVTLWDVANRKELRRLKQHPSTVHSLALSPDGRLLLTGCGVVSKAASESAGLSDDYSIRLWNVDTGRQLAVVGSHKDTVTGLSFGGDATEAVSCSNDNTVCLWKLPTAKESSRTNPDADSGWEEVAAENWQSHRIVNGRLVEDKSAWVVQDGTVRCDSILDSIIASPPPQSYADFELELQAQVPDGKILGVVVRGSAVAQKMVMLPLLTVETVSLLGNVMRPKWEKDGTVALIEAIATAARPVPAWNTLRIRCVGNRISATLNSVALDDELSAARVFREPLSTGQIGLLNPAGTAKDVVVRNIRIRTFD